MSEREREKWNGSHELFPSIEIQVRRILKFSYWIGIYYYLAVFYFQFTFTDTHIRDSQLYSKFSSFFLSKIASKYYIRINMTFFFLFGRISDRLVYCRSRHIASNCHIVSHTLLIEKYISNRKNFDYKKYAECSFFTDSFPREMYTFLFHFSFC